MNNRFTLNCLSLAISSLLLLPAVNGHAAETTQVQGGNGYSYSPSLSAEGRFVAFYSSASNLVAGDTNGTDDVFVLDRIAGTTTRVSVDSTGQEGNANSSSPVISADGRVVAFSSLASNLMTGDTNGTYDIFVHDRNTGETTRVSVDSAGQQGNSQSRTPFLSADGRFVAFQSDASNLVSGDTNDSTDVFVYDRNTGETTRVSVNSTGQEGNSESYGPTISADGRYVSFTSSASNLVARDTNGADDAFVHDRTTGKTTRVSVNSTGQEGNSESYGSTFNADGRFVAFYSEASNLVADDSNNSGDIFVHDRNTGSTTRVSVDSAGQQGNSSSFWPAAISADGRFVSFYSGAFNLVAEDTDHDYDVFVHDRNTGSTTCISVCSEGGQTKAGGVDSAISADGRLVAFRSNAPQDNSIYGGIFIRDRQLIRNKTADLQLAVTSQPVSVQTGQTASYSYTFTNNGPDNINGTAVKLINVISNGDLISLTPSQGGCSKAAVSVCNFGGLAVGASVTLTAEIKAGGDPLTQQISVNAPPVDDVPDNNSLTVSTPVTP